VDCAASPAVISVSTSYLTIALFLNREVEYFPLLSSPVEVLVPLGLSVINISLFHHIMDQTSYWASGWKKVFLEGVICFAIPVALPATLLLQDRFGKYLVLAFIHKTVFLVINYFFVPVYQGEEESRWRTFLVELAVLRGKMLSVFLSAPKFLRETRVGDWKADLISEDPFIAVVRGVVSEEDAKEISAAILESPWESSSFSTYGTDFEDIHTYERNVNIGRLSVQHLVPTKWEDQIRGLVEKLSGFPASHMENFKIQRYQPGCGLGLHFDKLSTPYAQRVCTMVFCYQEAEEGGETCFPNLGIKVALKVGQVLIFRYSAKNHPNALLHSSIPVRSGEKIIQNQFTQNRPAVLVENLKYGNHSKK
jgi:prolyl 4-hydroxylase